MSSDRKIYYKGMRVNFLGLPIFTDDKKSRIKKKDRKKDFYHISFSSPFVKDAPKNLIVMYDIPHDQKKERDWFRRNLIKRWWPRPAAAKVIPSAKREWIKQFR